MDKINLGAKLRDEITGFRGVCIGVATFIDAGSSALLQPTVNEEGEIPDAEWIKEEHCRKD